MHIRKTTFTQRMEAAGVCDSRGMAVCVTAAELPGGEQGLCLLGLQDSVLSVYEVDISANVGRKICEVPLKTVSEMKTSENRMLETIRGYSLRLVSDGKVYAFKNCYQHRAEMDVIRSEVR